MYCIWKSYGQYRIDGWNHNPVVEDLDYSSFYQKKASDYLLIYNPTFKEFMNSF